MKTNLPGAELNQTAPGTEPKSKATKDQDTMKTNTIILTLTTLTAGRELWPTSRREVRRA